MSRSFRWPFRRERYARPVGDKLVESSGAIPQTTGEDVNLTPISETELEYSEEEEEEIKKRLADLGYI